MIGNDLQSEGFLFTYIFSYHKCIYVIMCVEYFLCKVICLNFPTRARSDHHFSDDQRMA